MNQRCVALANAPLHAGSKGVELGKLDRTGADEEGVMIAVPLTGH